MTDQELERRLADAVTRAAPDDVAGVLSRCGTQTGNVIPIAQTAPRRTRRWAPLAIAACLVLAAAGGGAGYLHHLNSAVASIVCLDVNPSVELTVNRNDYSLASTIGIFIFMLVGSCSLLVYNRTGAVKKEDQFQ